MSCRVALLKLERGGLLHLPPAGPAPPKRTRRQPVEPFQREPASRCSLSQLGDLTLVLINGANTKASRQWNELMNQHRYLGSGPLCGAQLRYLIHSYRYGYIGGVAFSAPAWRLKPRDQWIGWNDETRWQNLTRMVNNSRFLIVPQVQVENSVKDIYVYPLRRSGPPLRMGPRKNLAPPSWVMSGASNA
jgi:hypothetical protein